MAEAKITVTGQDLASAVLAQVGQSADALGQKVGGTGVQFTSFRKSLEDLRPEATTTTGVFSHLKDAIDDPTSAAKSLGSALLNDLTPAMGGISIGTMAVAAGMVVAGLEMFKLGGEAEEVGASIGKTAALFNTSNQSISNLRFAITAAGGDFSSFGNVLFMFQNRMENSSASVDKGLKQIGLSVEGIKSMSADQQFLAISDAIRTADSSVNKAAVAFDIFGKQGRDVLPLLMKPLGDLADESERLGDTWNDHDVAAARAFRGEVAKLGAETEEAWTVLGRTVAPVSDAVTIAWDRMKLAIANVALTAVELVTLKPIAGWLGDNALAAETAAAKQDTINRAMDEGAPKGIRYAEAVAFINERYKEMKPAAEQAADAAQAWLKKLGEGELAANKAKAADDLLTEGLAAQGIVRGAGIEDVNTYTESLKKASDEAKKHATEQHKLADELLKVEHSLTDIPDSLGKIGRSYDESKLGVMSDAVAKIEQNARILNFGYKGMSDELENVGEKTKVAIDAADGWAFVGPQLEQIVAKARGMSAVFADFPTMITQAMTGGGGVTGALKALGSSAGQDFGQNITDNLTKHLTDDGAKALSPMLGHLVDAIPMIGAMVGPLIGPVINGIKSMFGGVSEEVKKARESVATFESTIAASLTTQQKAEAGNSSWKATVIGIRDAYMATGKSEAEALAAAQNLWDSSKSGAAGAKAAIDQINAVLNEQKQDQADLKTATEKYKFSLEELGPAMQKQQLSEQAAGLENDFRLLVGSGMDVKTVLDHMGGSINDFLHDAQKTGSEVPSEMKPMIEKMIEMGTLTDANGNKITDLGSSGITFSETMTQGFDKIVGKLTDLINKIAGTTGALNAIPSSKTIDITYNQKTTGEAPGGRNGDGGDQSFATEGFDLTTPRRAVVGDSPFSSESILHASTVRDIVRASRTAGSAQTGGGLSTTVLEGKFDTLHDLLKRQGQQIAQALGVQTFAARDAVLARGTR